MTYEPTIVTYKERWQERGFVCGEGAKSVLQIVFENMVEFKKVNRVSSSSTSSEYVHRKQMSGK